MNILNENSLKMKKPIKTKKMIKRSLKDIRNEYKLALKNRNESTSNEWLCDNYYIFEREGVAVIKSLKKADEIPAEIDKTPRIYRVCEKICSGGVLPDESKLELQLKDENLTIAELELIPVMLKAVLISVVASSCAVGKDASRKYIANAVKSLRAISDIDFESLIEKISEVEHSLRQDPTGIYSQMDDSTRAYYRHRVANLSKKQKIKESDFANKIVLQAKSENKHIGDFLDLKNNNKKRGWCSIVVELALPLIACVWVGIALNRWYLPFLLYLPFFEIFYPVVNLFAMMGVSPTFMPRIKKDDEMVQNTKTLVVVSMLLPSAQKANQLASRLIALKRSNGQGNTKFCILADFKSSKSPINAQDEADLLATKKVIDELNEKYGGFILAVRPRIFSKTQNEYTGWERKRGAITQLVRAIKGETTQFQMLCGDLEGFGDTKYIMALDSDTNLPLDTVNELVAVATHPINVPVIDESKGRVVSGYGIFTPKIETEINSAFETGFARIMASVGGITAYNNTSSDKYQDLFDEAIFAGKGLIDVDMFHKLLNDGFPPEQVLSHDILEGGYLRVGFVSDVAVTDSFPSRQGAYLDRLHRWVRGDWQNLGFIFKKPPKNPLNSLSRVKLLDNLRRSITPVISIIALILSLFIPHPISRAVAVTVFFGACFGEIFSGIYSLVMGGASVFSRLYYSNAMPAAIKSLIGGGVSVLMLAQNSWVCIDAIFKAIWRQFVSRKNMLQWVTAADSDRGQGFWGFLKRYSVSIILGVVMIAFGGSVHTLFGLAFFANVPFAYFSANVRKSSSKNINPNDKEKLRSYAAAMWKYYDELCLEGDNYLPPDNFQETPVHRIAHRTSPTNIGLMLLCTLCAKDFGFIDTKTMCDKLEKSISTIEKLEKWEGNLLNWYNTKNLAPLKPRYVSAVDSGNFLCCLVALRQGLLEFQSENEQIPSLVERINKLIDQTNLKPLYNEQRKLFFIGYNVDDNSFSNSYYDLLMSEARMTSFYAIASRQVSKEHWGALGRTLATDSRYAGPISWTGTMFEYYMPHLLLPVYENTMYFEALRFCSWCQKRRVKGRQIPWGISESGFYAFDQQLNYQYKAHGVQKLGLKRGLNSDLVISPYSTFLVLPFEPKAAMKNLLELEEMQMTGRCGFYEAADFTVDRMDGQDYAVIRSYMAHHLGMSMICISNLLMDNLMQKRFMSDDKMAGAVSLLQEKVPADAMVFRDVELRDVPQRPQRDTVQTREFANINPLSPNMRLYTNGEWSTIMCDNGASISRYRGADITRMSNDLLKRPLGIFAFVKNESIVLPITKALDYNSDAKFKASYSNTEMTIYSSHSNLDCSMTVMVHPRLPCEQRRITIKNSGKSEFVGELVLYFEPSLILHRDESEHPAFSKLFIQGDYDNKNKLLSFSRQARNAEQPLCIASGFLEETQFSYGMAREEVLQRPDGIFSLLSSDLTLQKEGTPDACAVFRIPISILPKQQITKTFILSAASTKAEAIDRALKARGDGKLLQNNAAPSPFKDDMLDGIIASTVLPYILFSQSPTKEMIVARAENQKNKRAIWEFGISGDNPIIFTQIDDQDDISSVSMYVRLVRKLRKSGISTDLVIAYKENGEYTAPILSAIRQMLKKENVMEGAGFFPIDLSKFEQDSITALMAVATYIAPKNDNLIMPPPKYKPFIAMPTQPVELKIENALNVKHGYFTHGIFTITQKPSLPWCVVLANPSFGTLVSDKSLGFSWAINSRENKLTPWSNDTMTDNLGEKLYMRIDDTVYDLVVGATVRFSKKVVQYIGTVEGINYDITVWVPHKGMIKHCDIRIENSLQEEKIVEIVYYTEPVMGVNRRDSYLLKSTFDGKAITVSNRCTSGPFGYLRVGLLCDVDFYTCNRTQFLNGNWNDNEMLPSQDSCVAVGKKLILPPKRQENVRFILSWGASQKASLEVTTKKLEIEKKENALYINTPDKELNYMFNTWFVSQIVNSRIYGRTGFYQCGGAYGFRDQLQDVSSLVLVNPSLVKTHIIRCAAHQFVQGDVLHWWHKMPKSVGGTKGVRTRYSDDLLWLPFIASEYAKKTGDYDLFNIKVPYLDGEELKPDEDEKYFELRQSKEKGTMYEHCIKVLERVMNYGEHGLALIGGGDWNDGFNAIGIKGEGESVWLTQFLAMTLFEFAPICEKNNDTDRAKRYREESQRLKQVIDETSWNGQWYMRAFFDDGTPLGVKGDSRCEIDSLTQSFSVLCDMPDKSRRDMALKSALEKLVDTEHGIIKLFAPPFTTQGRQAGYVNAYPPGIRENGGQYTHAAVWFCRALIKNGQQDLGYNLLRMINPAYKYGVEKHWQRYKTEAYALSGDVYSKTGIEGRGGWSLYTGAAGWYYRTVYEELLGITQIENKLYLNPALPTSWKGYTAKLLKDGAVIDIAVKHGTDMQMKVDGKLADFVPLDGENHSVILE